ncbi:hypothetical protein HPB52_005322 [Rhipicephalus sanguineus]|uniref:UBC core domain-containing protein n=1 Tax=Rhipicephalus sanguineus TaxID=34632 RepID=A0A9D4SRH6_RHISA|nr:hypothetical protein HPB52_005322 [Rhipicephalus sanguineus]
MAAAAGRGETAAETYSYDRNAGDGHGPLRGAALPVSSCPVSTVALARIRRELEEIRYSPLTNCSAGPISSCDLFKWTATIVGPEETPYEGGVFLLDVTFPEDYPFNPPMKVATLSSARAFSSSILLGFLPSPGRRAAHGTLNPPLARRSRIKITARACLIDPLKRSPDWELSRVAAIQRCGCAGSAKERVKKEEVDGAARMSRRG